MKYAIALIALALPTYLIRFDIAGIPTTLLELIIYAVFVWGLINIGYSQWKNIKTNFWLPIGILLIGAIVSTIISPSLRDSLGVLKAYFIDPLLVLFLIIVYLKPADYLYVLLGLYGSSIFVSGHAIYQKIIHNVTADDRVIGIFGYSPNYLALYLAPIAILLLVYGFYFAQKLDQKAKMWCWVATGLNFFACFMAIYFSGSRGGLLALGAGIIFAIIVYFWKLLSKVKWVKIALAVVILVGIIAVGYIFKPNFSIDGSSGGRVSTSNNIRFQIWETSIEIIKSKPILGVGLGNFQNYFSVLTAKRVNFPEYITPLAFTPHNIFLTFYLTTSLFGLIGFIWILVLALKNAFKNISKPLNLALSSSLVVMLAQGLVDTPYFKNDLSLFFWIVIAGVIIINRKNTTQ